MCRCLFLSAALLGALGPSANGDNALPADLSAAAVNAVSDDSGVAANAIQVLRDAGPAGLDALFQTHRALLLAQSLDPNAAKNVEWQRLKSAIDTVAAQRDAYTSRLYWHTDLSAAIAAARREGKPILSLRLLGKLTDEYSCANSRFFRTALYANGDVGAHLRDRFVLHWESVRPVPKVTIDFGDGRKIERTLTGNSIHYVLDSSGRPFDALPGLYGPAAFLAQLELIEAGVAGTNGQPDGARNSTITRYHQQRLQEIRAAWERDLTALNINLPGPAGLARPEARANSSGPAAFAANAGAQAAPAAAQVNAAPQRIPVAAAERLAKPKSIVEFPVLRLMAQHSTEALRAATTPDVWDRLGAMPEHAMALDGGSISLIRRQNPGADSVPAEGTVIPEGGSLSFEETRLAAMLRNFQAAMSADTVRNEYELHRAIHEWMISSPDQKLDKLNERVYAELFLTPRTDPWLGLVTPETYTALEHGGQEK